MVVVEVKTRHQKYEKYLLESLTKAKRRRLMLLAESYRKSSPLTFRQIRVDVLGVIYNDKGQIWVHKHIKAIDA